MLTSWLSSVLNLLTFFRYTLIWLDVNLLPFSILSGYTILGFTVLGLSVVAIIFNVTVCVIESKTKKRTRALPPAKISVICLDFIFAACYMVVFTLSLLAAIGIRWNPREFYSRRINIFAVQTYAGVLVAWHYHLFFAAVSLHSWRQQRNVQRAHRSTEVRMEGGEVVVAQGQPSSVTVEPKTPPAYST